jgi:hypothetical protein
MNNTPTPSTLVLVPLRRSRRPRADPLAHDLYPSSRRESGDGEMGVRRQSHWFSVGAHVTWAEAGVGAVATQSFVDPGIRHARAWT